jgi:hypothetical protein
MSIIICVYVCMYVCVCVCEFPVDVKLMKMVEKQDQVISSLEKQVCNCVYICEYHNICVCMYVCVCVSSLWMSNS